jgi:hypothetical protein
MLNRRIGYSQQQTINELLADIPKTPENCVIDKKPH